MSIENIKDKIRKLLALSADNPSEAESYSALQKAQELMARYKIEAGEVSPEDAKKQECVQRKTTLKYTTRSSDHYLNDLAAVIARNFCCINYISTPHGTQSHYICFMGLKDDVDIAEEVLHAANTYIIKGYNRVYREACQEYDLDYLPAKYFNPLKTGYIDGYLDGLKDALEAQKEKNQEWGLVLVVPQEAQDFKINLNKVDFGLGAGNFTDRSYYDKGYEDGNSFQTHKRLGETKKLN